MIVAAIREETPFHRFVAEFAASRLALGGLVVFVLIAAAAILAPLIAPQNPYDLAQLDIMDGRLPQDASKADWEDAKRELVGGPESATPRHAGA